MNHDVFDMTSICFDMRYQNMSEPSRFWLAGCSGEDIAKELGWRPERWWIFFDVLRQNLTRILKNIARMIYMIYAVDILQ